MSSVIYYDVESFWFSNETTLHIKIKDIEEIRTYDFASIKNAREPVFCVEDKNDSPS